MDRRVFSALLFALWWAIPSAHAETASPHPLPDANEVIRHFVERAAVDQSNRLAGAYVFYRTNITDEFSRQGNRTKHETLLLQVTVAHNDKKIELKEINGREPTAEEREEQMKRFEQGRESAVHRDKPNRSRRVETFITMDVLGRYVFGVRGRETINGRPCLMVTFKPGAGLSDSGRLFERVLNHIGGILWIDETEYELVKADVQLRDRISLWGGLLGSLDQIHLRINRHREADGRWRDREVDARFVGRALTRHINVETRDLSSAAQPVKPVPVVASQ